jgi:hypothetical protein
MGPRVTHTQIGCPMGYSTCVPLSSAQALNPKRIPVQPQIHVNRDKEVYFLPTFGTIPQLSIRKNVGGIFKLQSPEVDGLYSPF